MVVAGAIIMVIVMGYTSYLASSLRDAERTKVELLASAMAEVADTSNFNKDLTIPLEIIVANNTIPVITVTDEDNLEARNFPDNLTYQDILEELEKLKRSGIKPIPFKGLGVEQLIYFKHSRLSTLISYFPLVMLLMLAAFMGFGYIILSSSRKAEQNQVWVGMAKETAHQLGTPISAIMAWIEHLKADENTNADQGEILDELTNDVGRLELIADRFSKIGSAPNLTSLDIYDQLSQSKDYMQKRASRKVKFDFPMNEGSPLYVNINAHLFNWVVENLLRNSLDAMGGEGLIKAGVNKDDHYVVIDISDTGKGIPSGSQKMVFQPGYTTKKRGWGLGLSLAKRIIENYHEGKIFVKKSEPNVGTTFTIKLPRTAV